MGGLKILPGNPIRQDLPKHSGQSQENLESQEEAMLSKGITDRYRMDPRCWWMQTAVHNGQGKTSLSRLHCEIWKLATIDIVDDFDRIGHWLNV